MVLQRFWLLHDYEFKYLRLRNDCGLDWISMVGPKNLSNTYNSDLQHTNVITQPPEPLFSSWLLNVGIGRKSAAAEFCPV